MNGKRVGQYELPIDGAIPRGGNQGNYQVKVLRFDADILGQNENIIELIQAGGEKYAGVMYDFIKLEMSEESYCNQ